ncbi:MAG: hypothetical protein R3D98_14255 [Candidatus Krumholzibacteriia bacterium]
MRDLVRHWLAVPAYRRLVDGGVSAEDLTDPDQLGQLPILTKARLTEGLGAWRAQAPRGAVANSTSGSSGANFQFLQDRAMRDANSAAVRWAYHIAGADYWSDRRLVIWGHSPPLGWRTHLAEEVKVFCLNARSLQAYGLDDERCDRYLAHCERWRPKVIEGYPTYLAQLARRGLATRELAHAPGVVITSGEQLDPMQRQVIEAYFRAPVSDRYGSREFGVIAQSVPGAEVCLVPPSRFLLESSEDGSLLITDLDNRATPFIRYACGDLGQVTRNSALAPAFGGQVITSLSGRVHDRITSPTGRLIPGQYWTLLSRSVPGIEEFQVYQGRDGRIELRVSRSSPLADDHRRALEARVAADFPEVPAFAVVRVDRFARTALGKRKFVIREDEHGA